MSETEKMYDNCGLLKPHGWSCKFDRIGEGKICELEKEVLHCKNCKYSKQEYYHRPFTAEKQINLIKWLSNTDYYIHNIYKTIDTGKYCIENCCYDLETDKFEDTLARLINKLWQDLTEEEKQQIKEILSE